MNIYLNDQFEIAFIIICYVFIIFKYYTAIGRENGFFLKKTMKAHGLHKYWINGAHQRVNTIKIANFIRYKCMEINGN